MVSFLGMNGQPFYPNGRRGHPPWGIEKRLRRYLLQCGFALSNEGIENAIDDSDALRSFMGIDFIHEQVPDATTWLKFRHLLEEHDLCKVIFQAITTTLEKCGYVMMCARAGRSLRPA
jgi:IS5 family transposase